MELDGQIEQVAGQERDLVLDHFTDDDAWDLGSWIRQRASAGHWPVVVDVRRFDRPLFFCALPGSTPDNPDWVRRKAATVQRFHRSTYRTKLELERDGTTLQDRFGLSPADYAAHGGGFPLVTLDSGVIGCVTVSGLPQVMDHLVVVHALHSLPATRPSALRLPPLPDAP